jgi:general secretion pathway protein D
MNIPLDRSSFMRWSPIVGAVLFSHAFSLYGDPVPPSTPDMPKSPPAPSAAPKPGELPPMPDDFPPELFELLFGAPPPGQPSRLGNMMQGAPGNNALPPAISGMPLSGNKGLNDASMGGGQDFSNRNNMVGQIAFRDESPYQVIDLLQRLTGESVFMGQDLPNVKINYSSPKPLSTSEAISELITVLSTNGIAIMRRPYEDPDSKEVKEKLAAVPASVVMTQAPQLMMDLPAHSSSGEYFAHYFDIKYMAPEDAEKFVQPLITPGSASMLPIPKLGKLFVIDKLYNLVQIRNLLATVDKPAKTQDQHYFFDLKYAKAEEVQKTLSDLMERGYKNSFQGNLLMHAEARSNRLLVVTHPENVPQLKTLIDGLDCDTASLLQTECLTLHYTSAEKIVPIIKELISSQKQNKSSGIDSSVKKDANVINAADFSEHVAVVADERGNKVVASGTDADIKQIRKLISQLDVRLPQVRIEVIITEVKLTDQSQRGINAFSFGKNYPTDGVVGTKTYIQDVSLSGAAAAGAAAPFTLNGRFFDGPFDLNMVFKQAQTNNNVRILSAPTIVTTHNREGSIEVIAQKPIVKDTIGADKTTTDTDKKDTSVRSTIDYKDIGIILKVKPLIGLNGTIQLEIDQTISDSNQNVDINNIPQPIVNKRQAKSFVSALDQEVIVLGGLRQNTVTDNKGKIFILGDIPVLGPLLFSPKTKTNEITELIIFIKPHIMLPDEIENPKVPRSATAQTAEIIDISENRDNIVQFLETGKFPEIKPQDMSRFGSTIFEEPAEKPIAPVPTSALPELIEETTLPPVVPDTPVISVNRVDIMQNFNNNKAGNQPKPEDAIWMDAVGVHPAGAIRNPSLKEGVPLID